MVSYFKRVWMTCQKLFRNDVTFILMTNHSQWFTHQMHRTVQQHTAQWRSRWIHSVNNHFPINILAEPSGWMLTTCSSSSRENVAVSCVRINLDNIKKSGNPRTSGATLFIQVHFVNWYNFKPNQWQISYALKVKFTIIVCVGPIVPLIRVCTDTNPGPSQLSQAPDVVTRLRHNQHNDS